MGRYVSPAQAGGAGAGKLAVDYNDSASTLDGDGYLTSYTSQNVEYSNIVYETDEGGSSRFGGTFKRVKSWTERNTITNRTQTVVVNYDSATGRVSSLTIT